MPHVDELRARLTELAYLKSTLSVLYWDSEVNMPPTGVKRRAETISYLSQLVHEKFLDSQFEATLRQAQADNKLSVDEQALVREVGREFEREKKLPTSFVSELAHVTAAATHTWAEARRQSNFNLFAPSLEKIVALKRQEADYVGWQTSPYDALLDTYEPYLLTADVFMIMAELKDFLVPFVQKIMASPRHPDPSILKGQFDLHQQKAFSEKVARLIGFNFEGGRLDSSSHPFSVGFHPEDVRITTRFSADDVLSAIMASLHEAGHGLYEQGFVHEHFGTPLAEATSLGIHESQSRLWENLVGRSLPFWRHAYPMLQEAFPDPFQNIPLEQFYPTINAVNPSLIRIEADEVTYNLHIILRFEVEKELIEGSIKITDLPAVWSAKVKEYFNVDVPDDAHGVLQDIHWSNGLIGYFPTYTLGNLYAAQLYHAASQQIPQLEKSIAHGQFNPLQQWLKTHIYVHGKRHSASDLIKTATGEVLNSQHFIEYLTAKYSDIYQLQ